MRTQTAKVIHLLLLALLFYPAGGCSVLKKMGAEEGTAVSRTQSGVTVSAESPYRVRRMIGDTPFPGVNGAAIGADGNLYVTHTGNGSITRIDLETMTPSTFVPPYGAAFILDDIASDARGHLYATGTTPLVGEVYRFDENGVKTVIAEGMAAPNGIEYNDRTGRLFVSECFQGNRIYEVDPAGVKPAELLVKENVIPVPEGFDFDPDTNDLIVPDMGSGKILRVHPDTGEISTVAENFTTPIALTIGADQMVYIPELATGAVYRMNLSGGNREKIAQIKPGLDNLAITDQGRLFVTSYWDATIYEVSTDGSGQYKQLFPEGPNQILGVVKKGDDLLVADAIMVRRVVDGKYQYTRLNAWAAHGMPLTLSLADGPGDHVLWTDAVHGAVAMGNPETGEFQPLAGGLDLPVCAIMGPGGSRVFVAEYNAGRIRQISLSDGSKSVLASGLEGPLAMSMAGGSLYVAENKAGRISRVNPETGEKAVLVAGLVGRPGALANDGSGNLLVLDGAGRQLIRINPETLAVSLVAARLPVSYASIGSYPPMAFPIAMHVTGSGDIYLPTAGRGLLMLEKRK